MKTENILDQSSDENPELHSLVIQAGTTRTKPNLDYDFQD